MFWIFNFCAQSHISYLSTYFISNLHYIILKVYVYHNKLLFNCLKIMILLFEYS